MVREIESNYGSSVEIGIGEVIDNARFREVFKCSTQGGMRRSLDTNTLVLVSNHGIIDAC